MAIENETTARRKAVLWVGAVLLLGMALGAVGMHLCDRHRIEKARAAADAAADAAHPTHEQRVEKLTKELGLSPEQRQQLDTILTQIQDQYAEIDKQRDAAMEQARQNGRNLIRAILSPEQKVKFEEHLRRYDEHRKRAAASPSAR